MLSTMQTAQLGLPLLLRHAHNVNGRSRLISRSNCQLNQITFSEFAQRAGRLGNALAKRGFGAGTVVGTFAGSTSEHLEAYLGIPASGCVLHTLNVRMHDDQLIYMATHAGDEVFIVDTPNLVPFCRIANRLENLRLVIVIGSELLPETAGLACEVVAYETLLDEGEPQIDWPDIDENSAAILCFTGGTTGAPKGVAYSHRSLWLQALSLCTANSLALSSTSRLLPAVPFYHVNGWGLPFAALMAGADLVLPSHSLHATDLLTLIDMAAPTIAAGVPTIWSDVLSLLHSHGRSQLGALQTIACGGAQVPRQLSDAYSEMGIKMVQAWGMTETSSMSALSQAAGQANSPEEARRQTAQGRIVCGLEVRVADLEGNLLPSDGVAVGELQIRGAWVTGQYLGNEDMSQFQNGWLRTGDLGTVDSEGYIALSDRAKDAIKSGGEWIPSLALEEAIRRHPDVQDVAVVAIPDARWQERPAAVLVLKKGCTPNTLRLESWLKERVARFWVPSSWFFVDALPRTAVGKVDKKQIRQLIQEDELSCKTMCSMAP